MASEIINNILWIMMKEARSVLINQDHYTSTPLTGVEYMNQHAPGKSNNFSNHAFGHHTHSKAMCIYHIELSVTKLVVVHSWKGGRQLQIAHEWKEKKNLKNWSEKNEINVLSKLRIRWLLIFHNHHPSPCQCIRGWSSHMVSMICLKLGQLYRASEAMSISHSN